MSNKLIILYTMLDDDKVQVTYTDNTKEIISNEQFSQSSKHEKMKMAFILPKED